MRANSAIALLVAVVLGGLAAFLARQFMGGLNEPVTKEPGNTIVVAAQPLGFGATLNADNLIEIPWPAENVMEGAFKTKADLLREGRRLTLVAIQRNEPILNSKITGLNQRATLSTLIDEGMRAVSVKVDEVRGVAGFILPGDRVDVVLTRSERNYGQDKEGPMADVLLQNVKVLAIDQLVNEQQDKPTVARAVTLELNVQQAQKVILAEGVGRLSLILRQAGEAQSADTRRVTLADLGLTEAVDTKEASRIASLEAQLDELRKAAALAESTAKEEAMRHIADLEARLRAEQNQKPQVPAAVALPKRNDRVIVNVIRGVSKRDEYSVLTEAR